LSFISYVAYSPLSLTPLGAVRAFSACAPTTPSADFCCPVRVDCSTLSLDSETSSRSPEVSSIAFCTQPPNLQPAPLMDMDFVVVCQLVRYRLPLIRFLFIGSYICSALLSDSASRLSNPQHAPPLPLQAHLVLESPCPSGSSCIGQDSTRVRFPWFVMLVMPVRIHMNPAP